MIVEVSRASGDSVEIGDEVSLYSNVHDEERYVNVLNVSSWDEVHNAIDEEFVVRKDRYRYDGETHDSMFSGVDHLVTILDARI